MLDLDLDAVGGGASSTFFEGFEGGDLGTFQNLNLDAGIPGNSDAEGVQNADGFRCQTSDPDWPNSTSYGSSAATDCYPGLTLAQADATFWNVDGSSIADSPDGGRAYSGSHALYYGVFLTTPAGEFTTPRSVLEGAGTIEPVDLGLDQPKLSFKHQISLLDWRATSLPPSRSIDRGVVQVQLADATGQPASAWLNLEPYLNLYDSAPYDNYFNCRFDPVDDGNLEDEFYSPGDPNRRLGPSSTCDPQLTYAHVGATSDLFEPESTGDANEGPGLAGSLGLGTWIESAFDLSRFRGRRVRLRFLVSSFTASALTWEEQFDFNPDPRDDGWWIDDVVVTDSVTSPVTLVADVKDNSGLPGAPGTDGDADGFNDACDNCPASANPRQLDGDVDGAGNACDPCPTLRDVGDDDLDLVCDAFDNCPATPNPGQVDDDLDGFGFACDCADLDGDVYPGAPEINDGKDNQCPGEPGYGLIDEVSPDAGFHDPSSHDVFSWTAQPGANRYRVARGDTPELCFGCSVSPLTTATSLVDREHPASGAVFYYLVRVEIPNLGSWGADSSGTERFVPCAGG